MKRTFFGLIIVITMVFFCSLVPSTASENMEVIMGEGIFSEDNIDMPDDLGDDLGKANSAPRAVSSLNYVKEVYTTTAPSSGETYNESAVRAFSVGTTIYFITRYYMATAGTRQIYHFISNAAGSVSMPLSLYSSSSVSTGNWVSVISVSGFPAGTYVVTTLILAPGNWMSNPLWTFIVE
jgi:hypothetical protein